MLSENGSENRLSFREFEEELVDIPQRDWRRIVLVLGLSWDLVQIGILGEKYERYDCDQTVTTRQTNQNKTKTIMIHRKNNSHKFFQPAKSVDKNLKKKKIKLSDQKKMIQFTINFREHCFAYRTHLNLNREINHRKIIF